MEENTRVREFLDKPETKELVKKLALAVNGPHNMGHWRETPEKLARLREIKWERSSMQEQGEAQMFASAALVELWEQGLLTV